MLSSKRKASPRTRLRGSLMLTVWSWEADRELFIDRSPVKKHGKNGWWNRNFSFFPLPPRRKTNKPKTKQRRNEAECHKWRVNFTQEDSFYNKGCMSTSVSSTTLLHNIFLLKTHLKIFQFHIRLHDSNNPYKCYYNTGSSHKYLNSFSLLRNHRIPTYNKPLVPSINEWNI